MRQRELRQLAARMAGEGAQEDVVQASAYMF